MTRELLPHARMNVALCQGQVAGHGYKNIDETHTVPARKSGENSTNWLGLARLTLSRLYHDTGDLAEGIVSYN